jgi:Transposase and inactivated derivatives, IS30 family
MKGRIGTQTTLFTLYPKSLIGKLRYVNDVKLTKEAKLRLKWIEYYEKVKDVTKTCRYFGISRTTFYKWLKRYQKDGLKGLLDRPKTPLRKRAPTVRKKYELDIIRIRNNNPTWSKEKIAIYLEKEKGIKVSPSTIYRVLKSFGLIERTRSIKQQRKKKYNVNKKRIKTGLKARAPGEVIQIDLKHLTLRGVTYYQYTAIDKYSRLAFAKVYKNKTSRNTKLFIQEAMKYFGFSISKVQTDNGSEFMGEFDKYLKEIGIEHYYSYPRTPKTNGNVERVIRTIEEELWFIEGIDYTIDHLNSLLKKYIEKYNFVRPHCSLGYRTPAEVAYGNGAKNSEVVL